MAERFGSQFMLRVLTSFLTLSTVFRVPQNAVSPLTGDSYVVELYIRTQPICGGTILHPQFVITACNCLASLEETGPAKPNGVPLEDYLFVAGTLHLWPVDNLTVQTRRPTKFYIHPQCEVVGSKRVWDIGAAKMETPYAIDDTVYPIKLLSIDFQTSEMQFSSMLSQKPRPNCRVSGWDRIWNSSNFHNTKNDQQSARMTPLENDKCLKQFRSLYPEQYENFNFEENKQFCATTEFALNPSLGDFGNPYVCDGFLMGVISNFGPLGVHSRFLPTVFQSVTVMLDWIQKNIIFECYRDPSVQTHSKTVMCGPHRLKVLLEIIAIHIFLS